MLYKTVKDILAFRPQRSDCIVIPPNHIITYIGPSGKSSVYYVILFNSQLWDVECPSYLVKVGKLIKIEIEIS